MDNEDMVYMYNGILVGHKKWNLAICTNSDGPREYYSKWNKQTEKDKYCMISLICGI